MPVLSYRFWKLTLQVRREVLLPLAYLIPQAQLIGRYKTWLEASLPQFEPPSRISAFVAAEKPVGAAYD